MPANSFNRQTARDALTTILTTALAGSVQTVFGYKVKALIDLGKGPFVTVDGGPISRSKTKFTGLWDTGLVLQVSHFVIWQDADSGWTEHDCEDRLDLLEKKLADAMLDHRSTAQDATVPWDEITFEGPSVPDVWIEKGKTWWTETFAVKARKLNG